MIFKSFTKKWKPNKSDLKFLSFFQSNIIINIVYNITLCVELLNSNQAKVVDELRDLKQQNIVVNNQLQDLNARLHMGGPGGKKNSKLIYVYTW